jgi:hypothetical protein
MTQLADSFMAIFGFKRVASAEGNVVTLAEQSQAQKEVTVNEALFRIESVLNAGAVSKSIATRPDNPAPGAVYIIPDNPAWPWTGKTGQIAYWRDSFWSYIIPNRGLLLWVDDEKAHYIYANDGWARVHYSGTGAV